MNRRGIVFAERSVALPRQSDRIRVGTITETPDGMEFRYDPEWLSDESAHAISLTLPLRAEPYASRGLHPYFAGLLPEGWLFDISISTLKLAADDGFGLLLALCRDCVGDVSIEPEIDTVPSDARESEGARG